MVSVAGDVPVPDSVAVWEPMLSVTEKIPVRKPEAVGAKLIDTVQPKFGARLVEHVFATMLKSPVVVGVWRVTGTPPMLEMVMFWAGVVATPMGLDPKFIDVGSKTMAAPGIPVPANCIKI